MTTTTNVQQVKLNVMTQSQYNSATKNANELYMITDAEVLPSQTGNSGKYLTTNGTTASWATVDALPSQSGKSGKFLTTNGTTASWADTPTEIPTQTGNSGKFLTTNGSAVSWASLPTVDQTYSGTSTNAQSGTAVKQAIDAAVSSVYKPAGSVAFANKPPLSSSIEGNVYNITDAFTTTSEFIEGAGKSYPAGTNIVCILTTVSGTSLYKWDVLAGFVDLSGYQTTITGGATTITSSNLTASRALISNSSGKVAVSDVTSTELGYLDGVTSAIQTQLDNKQATLTSGTNIKTINNTSVLGSGNIDTHELPSQTGNSGKFLTTNGSAVSWASVDAFPTQTGNSGKFLTTNGTSVSWATVDALPSQTSQSGKYLTTNGTTASWATIDLSGYQTTITGAATTITTSDLTASKALISNASGKVAVSSVTSVELGYLSGVTSAIQTQINNKQGTITGAATTIVSSNLTASKAVVSDSSGKIAVSSVTSTELGYLSGVTSAIQTQLNNKQGTVSGGASTITSDNLTASRALVSNSSGKVAVSDITATELGYLDNVTSNIQTQLNGKQATLTSSNAGNGITISNSVISETYPLAWEQLAESSDVPQFNTHVNWGNIDGTLSNQTDLQAALNAKANDSGVVHKTETETISGTKAFTGNSTSNTPAASASTNTTYIATTGWVNDPALSTNVVHRSGNETIGGVKTFIDVIQGVAYNAYYGDLAECYETDEVYPKGTLVIFGGKKELTIAKDEVNGVISSDPAYVLNKRNNENFQPIALIGRVPVRVIGKVDKFDYITLCKMIPGVGIATKDKTDKNIIGRALQSSILPGEKLIECSIKLIV